MDAVAGIRTEIPDRIGILTRKRTFCTQLEVYALLALYSWRSGVSAERYVKTVTRTSMLYRLGELYYVPVIETPVGFKFVCSVNAEYDALIGGEESGGLRFSAAMSRKGDRLYWPDSIFWILWSEPANLVSASGVPFQQGGPASLQPRDFHFPEERAKRSFALFAIMSPYHRRVQGCPVGYQ
jgi:hypothetical protein